MVYAYVRVSTNKQETDNQRFGLEDFAKRHGLVVYNWLEEEQSGGTDWKKRELYGMMKRLQRGDMIICTELSRLGRTLLMVMEILKFCMDKGIEVWTQKDNYRLRDDIQSKVLAFAFGIAAEIERNMISQRTKEALARKRAEGVVLGRPKGSKSSKLKLTGRNAKIEELQKSGVSVSAIGRLLRVHRLTVSKFMLESGISKGVRSHADKSTKS